MPSAQIRRVGPVVRCIVQNGYGEPPATARRRCHLPSPSARLIELEHARQEEGGINPALPESRCLLDTAHLHGFVVAYPSLAEFRSTTHEYLSFPLLLRCKHRYERIT